MARALADAEAGDPKARDWITKHILGDSPPRLIEIAAREKRGETPAEEISALADQQAGDAQWAAQIKTLLDKMATS